MAKEYLDKTGLQYLWGKLKSYFVADVKVDDASVVTNGVADIPKASGSQYGVVKVQNGNPEGYNTYFVMLSRDGSGSTGGFLLPKLNAEWKVHEDALPLANSSTYGVVKISKTNESSNGFWTLTGDTGYSKSFPVLDGSLQINTSLIPDMTGATTSANGTHGLVPAPSKSSIPKLLTSDGSWNTLAVDSTSFTGGVELDVTVGLAQATEVIANATSSANGTMSKEDKTKLDSITMTNGVINTTCLPSVLTASDKYTRSSTGDLQWTNQTDGDAKVMMKSAVAFWSGAYNGTSSNLSYFNANAYFGGTQMKDFATDQGTSSSWYYRKWKSGKIEAWTTYNAGSQTPSQWVTGWYYKDVNVAIPSGIFSATPTHVQATNVGSDYQYSVFTACPTSSTSIKVRVVKPNSGGATPVLSIYASNM